MTKNKLQGLKRYKDYCIESELSTGDKTLSFLYPANLSKDIVEEGYIRNKTDEFVIKSISTQGNWKTIKAKLNVEDLEGKVFELFDTTNETITDCINLALAGTGWIVGTCDVTRRRTVRKTNSSSWDIIQEARKVYRCELEFDTLNKKVNIYEKRGSDKGVYFLDSLNLKDLNIQSDSYDFYTRIIAKGKDDLKVVLENFQYSNKVKTYIWKDERYTDIDSLTEDAEAKLNELSKPYRAYSATIIDLANISKEDYKNILSYSLGDVITIVSKENGIKEKQRIIKMVEYPDEPHRNTCEIANTTLTFEEIQKEFQDTTDTVHNITTDNGTVDGSTINGISTEQIYDFEYSVAKIADLTVVNARIDDLYANKANISELNTLVANVAELNATKANITDLNVINANIEKLIAADATINNALIGKADITELNAVKGTIISLDSKIANIETLVNGNLSSENIQAGGITSDKLTIANGFITNAMIASLDVAKINAGDFSTNKFRIVSDSGNMLISDNTIQIRDKNRVRVQIGKDASNDYNMYVWDSAGKLMFDATGLKADGIKNKIIRDDMISDNANIDGAKLNISSLITEINKDTNTSVIKSSKVQLDTVGQTLEVAFNSLKSNVDSKETRNLFIEKNTVDGYYNDTSFVNSSSYRTSDYIEVTEGEIYTLCKFSTDGYHRIIDFDKDKNRVGTRLVKQDTILKYIIPSNVKYIRISIEKANKYKVEKGENPNPIWSAAPEDIDSSIEDVKQITESNSTTINVMQGQIATAINNTQIVKDGQIILLKDDYNRTVTLVNSINSTIGTHTTKIDELSGNITSVDTKVNSVQRDLEGTKSTVSSHSTSITDLSSKVSTQGASISQLQNEIALKVEQTDITTAINNIQIDGRNAIVNSTGNLGNTSNWSNVVLDTNKKVEGCNSFKITRTNYASGNPRYQGAQTIDLSRLSLQANDYITLSGWVYVDSSVALSGSSNNFAFRNYYDSSNNFEDLCIFNYGNVTKNTWTKFSITSKVTKASYKAGTVLLSIGGNGLIWVSKLKLEKGTKATGWTPAIEDVDTSIANVQTQVTTTSNKVTTIETNLSSITQRVSSTESSVATINGNITSLQNRMNTAEQKITDSAIISTVQSTINTAKNEAINSANSATDNKLKSYATTSSLTQTANNIKAEFKATGGYNVIPNSTGYNGTNLWTSGGATMGTATNNNIGGATNMYMYLDNGTKTTESFAFSKRFKLKANTKYTLSGWFHNFTKCPSFDVFLLSSTSVAQSDTGTSYTNVQTLISSQNTSGSWKKFSVSFTTPASVISGYIRIDNNGYNSSGSGSNRVHWSALILNEGEEQPWSPHPDEIYSGSTIIDASGITVNNGALTIKNKAGETVLNSDTNGNLVFTGVAKSQNGDQYVSLDSGGISFQDWNKKEQLLRMGSSSFSANRDMNGVTLAMPLYADFLRIAHVAKADLTNGWKDSDTQFNFIDFWSSTQTVGGITYKKGINVYAPLFINDGIQLYSGTSFSSELLGAISWNNGSGSISNLLGAYGDNGCVIGYKSGENLKARIIATEAAHPGTGDNIRMWGNVNCSGGTVHNATFSGRFVNSYANTFTRSLAETTAIEAEGNQVRINLENIQIKNGKAILNIPNRYYGIHKGYIINSIVKKGRGDVWVSEEQENRFIIEAENDIKINIELIIKLEDSIALLSVKEDAPIINLNENSECILKRG